MSYPADRRLLYLSPHFDDVALSCGGTISRQVRDGEAVGVVTVFGDKPEGSGTSCLINSFHDVMGNPARLVQQRREEDAGAFGRFGLKPGVLPFPDAIYRGRPAEGVFYYETMAALFGGVHPSESALPEAIATEIDGMTDADTTIVAPLGLGGHVDHRLVYSAASGYLSESHPVLYYEEFPYGDPKYPGLKGLNTAGVHRPLEEVTAELTLKAVLSPFESVDLMAKIAAIGEYRSQLRLIFGRDPQWPDRIEAFARRFASAGLAERFWEPASPGVG